MPLSVNLRHLANDDLSLKGTLPIEELDLTVKDELVQAKKPLKYDFQVEKLDESLLLQGRLVLTLDCECSRCLKPFEYKVVMENWVCDVPLVGEERAPVINDCVDLTPYLREDILLGFPQHPLCDRKCRGLQQKPKTGKKKPEAASDDVPSPWSGLDKLKF